MHLPTQTKWVCVCVYKQNAAPWTDKIGKCSAAFFSLFSRQTVVDRLCFFAIRCILLPILDFFLECILHPEIHSLSTYRSNIFAHQKQIHFTGIHAKQVTTKCSHFTARVQKKDTQKSSRGPSAQQTCIRNHLKNLSPMGRWAVVDVWSCLIYVFETFWILFKRPNGRDTTGPRPGNPTIHTNVSDLCRSMPWRQRHCRVGTLAWPNLMGFWRTQCWTQAGP